MKKIKPFFKVSYHPNTMDNNYLTPRYVIFFNFKMFANIKAYCILQTKYRVKQHISIESSAKHKKHIFKVTAD